MDVCLDLDVRIESLKLSLNAYLVDLFILMLEFDPPPSHTNARFCPFRREMKIFK